MWFAKLFGGRRAQDSDDPPAVAHVPQPKASRRANARPTSAAKPRSNNAQSKGFDPYNSGAFECHNAWERVYRR